MNTARKHHYNPSWLSDDDLVAGFVARQSDLDFFRKELARAPLMGSVQHYLLIGVRGAGKSTLLRRLTIEIRRNPELSDHLVALSFPEELYQVKNLADFWWAACEVLADELDFLKKPEQVKELIDRIDSRDRRESDDGLQLLKQTCERIGKRPVLLVDNLDMVFERIDSGKRKRQDQTAYWALREALSTTTSPIVIGGSARLSEPFTDYDKAFYEFFIPRRLMKLSQGDVRRIIERWARDQNAPEIAERVLARPSRIDVLVDLTGGNPRALGLIFELLRSGPGSRAVEDFERLLDITTPYYKARIEELSDQAQVVMHALAVRSAVADGLRFGHTAAELAAHAGLPTNTMSAQLVSLENEGLVEKSADHGRVQYRIAEQLFRLWLQMRSTRRVRENVILLTNFFEAMYDLEELKKGVGVDKDASHLSGAKYSFAVAGISHIQPDEREQLEAYGTGQIEQHLLANGGKMEDYLPESEMSVGKKNQRSKNPADLDESELREWARNKPDTGEPWRHLGHLLFKDGNRQNEAEDAYRKAIEIEPESAENWHGLGRVLARVAERHDEAEMAYRKAIEIQPNKARSWTSLGRLLSKSPRRKEDAEAAYRKAIELDGNSLTSLLSLASLLLESSERAEEGEELFQRALELAPDNVVVWRAKAVALHSAGRNEESVSALRLVLAAQPQDMTSWRFLAVVLSESLEQYEETENVLKEATTIHSDDYLLWLLRGHNLAFGMRQFTAAVDAYNQAIRLAPNDPLPWEALGFAYVKLGDKEQALDAGRKAIELDPGRVMSYLVFAELLVLLGELDSAVQTYQEAIVKFPDDAALWGGLGNAFKKMERYDEALSAYQRISEQDPASERDETLVRLLMLLRSIKESTLSNEPERLREAFAWFLKETRNVAAALVSEQFVESFLAPLLEHPLLASAILEVMRATGYEKYARPLLLAFEAAIEKREDMLSDLEPELRDATRLMFGRLTAVKKEEA